MARFWSYNFRFFRRPPPNIYNQYNAINFDIVNASICDTLGQYLFHTNGISIVNNEAEIIENGERINPGNFTDDWVGLGIPLQQGALILPLPDNESHYYLFHETRDWSLENPDGHPAIVNYFYYSIIDMNENNQKGKVIEKNNIFINGVEGSPSLSTIGFGKITAIRHANGRDWWIVIAKYKSNQYFVMLFDDTGIQPAKLEMIGDTIPEGAGQGFFSPNGLKYVNVSLGNFEENYIGIYDFDRGTGEFMTSEVLFDDYFAVAGGGAISENSRFLYYAAYTAIYQYDLEADDINASKVLVAEYDEDFTSPPLDANVKFFMAQLAPNGKIYINSNTQVKYYSIIHEPNKKGLACRAEPHGVELSSYNVFSLPNFPYYGLGPLDGSPADTLNIDNPPPTALFEYVGDSLELHDITFFNATLFSPEATMDTVPDDAYSWNFGDGEMGNEKHPQHTYTEDGIYEVCLTATNYSGSDTWCDILYINVVGVEEPKSPLQYAKLFPNPIDDYLYFDYLLPKRLFATAYLYDMQGRLLRERRLKTGNVSQVWNLHDLASGIYYFVVRSEGSVFFREKVVKI